MRHVHDSHYIGMSPDGGIYMEDYSKSEHLSIYRLKIDNLGSREIPIGVEPPSCLWLRQACHLRSPKISSVLVCGRLMP